MTRNDTISGGDLQASGLGRRLRFLGVAILVGGAAFAAYQAHLAASWRPAEATVLSVDARRSSNVEGGYSTSYQPTVEFTDPQGNRMTAAAGHYSSQSNYPIGTRLPIIYNPKNPRTFRIYTPGQFWMLPGATIALGCLVLALARWLS